MLKILYKRKIFLFFLTNKTAGYKYTKGANGDTRIFNNYNEESDLKWEKVTFKYENYNNNYYC